MHNTVPALSAGCSASCAGFSLTDLLPLATGHADSDARDRQRDRSGRLSAVVKRRCGGAGDSRGCDVICTIPGWLATRSFFYIRTTGKFDN